MLVWQQNFLTFSSKLHSWKSVKSSNLLVVTVSHKHTFHPKSVHQYNKCHRVSKNRKRHLGISLSTSFRIHSILFSMLDMCSSACKKSNKCNMHSLMPYHIEIQAAGLLWNNSIDNSIQEQHHKTKYMFIFCVYPQLYTPQFLHHHAKSKCTTILSDLHRHFHFVFSYICMLPSDFFLKHSWVFQL